MLEKETFISSLVGLALMDQRFIPFYSFNYILFIFFSFFNMNLL